MIRVIVLLSVFILCSNVFCTCKPPHSFSLGSTQITLRDTQIFDSSLEKSAFTKFIKGDYVGFSNDLTSCSLFYYSSIEDFLSHDINEIYAKSIGLDLDTFISSDTCGIVYYGLYNVMLNDDTFCHNASINATITEPREIIESPAKWLFGEGWPVFSLCGLLYEMVTLRAAYIYANEKLGNRRFGQLKKMLDFPVFYKELDERAELEEARLELEKHSKIIDFFRNWVSSNKDSITKDSDLNVIVEKNFRAINTYELALSESAGSICEFFLKNVDICDDVDNIVYSIECVFDEWEEYCHNKLHRDVCFYHYFRPSKYFDDQLKTANDLLREVHESGGHVHDDFIRFKAAIDEGDLFKAICYEEEK